MILSNDDIKQLLKTPKNAHALLEVARMEVELNALANGVNIGVILKKYAALHTKELYNVILGMFKAQAKSFLAVDGGAVFSHFQKVFNTQETENIQYTFSDTNELASFIEYIESAYLPDKNSTGISSHKFYRDVFLKESLYYPNSKLVIDFPNETTKESKPYVSLAKSKEIHDIDENANGISYLILKSFYKVENKIAKKVDTKSYDYIEYRVYDSEKYSLWRSDSTTSEPREISSIPHEFGYCPAISVSGYNESADNCIVKKSQILDSLADIEQYTFVKNAYNYYHMQKGSPASVGISSPCDYIFKCGTVCTTGYMTYPVTSASTIFDEIYTTSDTTKPRFTYAFCQKCERKKQEKFHLGKQVDVRYEHVFLPNGDVKADILAVIKSSLGSVPSDTNFLEFTQNWLAKMEAKIKGDITGEGFNMAQSKENFNKEYLSLSTDDKQNNLSVFSDKMEIIQEFIESTLAKARYETFESIYVNYGRQYFLKTSTEYQKEITELTNTSGDVFTILQKINQLQKTQNTGNYLLQVFGKIITSVVPHTDLPKVSVIANKTNLVTNDTEFVGYLIRIYAVTWIQEFMMLNPTLMSNATAKTLRNRFSEFMHGKAIAMLTNDINYFTTIKIPTQNGKAIDTRGNNPIGIPNNG